MNFAVDVWIDGSWVTIATGFRSYERAASFADGQRADRYRVRRYPR